MLRGLGKITVPVAGTPVRCSSTQTIVPSGDSFPVHSVLIQALTANSGKVYIGDRNMVVATLANVIAVLAIPSGGAIPSFSVALTLAPNAINLADLFLDVDVNGEGALVSILIA